jgi:hypothetical protein
MSFSLRFDAAVPLIENIPGRYLGDRIPHGLDPVYERSWISSRIRIHAAHSCSWRPPTLSPVEGMASSAARNCRAISASRRLFRELNGAAPLPHVAASRLIVPALLFPSFALALLVTAAPVDKPCSH